MRKMNSLVFQREWATSCQAVSLDGWDWIQLSVVFDSVGEGGRAQACRNIVSIRVLSSLMVAVELAQRLASLSTKGSFIRVKAWAGTLETVRRATEEKGLGMSKASIMGGRKFRRILV